ncbi:hypothetical protein BUALT_Bualt14G0043600 [Buddleja alternifolia]|uniref:Uncharacterized protein n=1 Tax=Buddleja alternifolia TaxID=168488 RepID=A0AAV6WPG0_9LAMI|nr:hypothetical protein BUALT_Bualt14G0043600 [Buddleja alternifolia]
MSPLYLHFFFLLLSSKFSLQQNTASSSDSINITKPGCPSKCGNLTVPYPFGVGIGSNCSMNPWFDVYCDASIDPPYMLVSTRDDYRLIDISESDIRIRIPYFASRCYGERGSSTNLTLDFSTTPYTLSDANRLTQIGCSDLAVLEGYSHRYLTPNLTQNNFASGCVSFCSDGDQTRNGSCPGNGCCQIPLPKATTFMNVSISGLQDRWGNGETKPCSYSFIGERDSFAFQAVSDLYRPPMTITNWLENVAVVLEWRIGSENCSQARNSGGFGCYDNSFCIDAGAGVGGGGYRCGCLRGYEGNPYLPSGCLDIDECKSNPCHLTGICVNTPGDYMCECPSGHYGNGWRNSTDCLMVNEPMMSKLSIGLVSGMGLLTLLSLSFLLTKFVKKRNKKKRRQKFFKQNGGLLLQQQISSNEGSTTSILGKTRIFTAKELEKATDRFNESRILGRGGQGTVYKGMLSDGQIVAIKKSQIVDEHKSKHLVEQFINEVVILSQINHRNVIKLLGCCLETRVPLLVYELVANGTLFEHIHDENIEFPISWNMRLKIAADIAGALAYLHSATSIPIFHRDIKSSNILLDEKYVAKVSDFGTSKSVAIDQTHLTTQVNGTFGYIDPEYFRSSQFTEKSDVYSFGVVLVELLTGLRPIIPSTNAEDDKSLVSRFLSSMKENNLESILDSQVSSQGQKDEALIVAKIAKRCLHLNGKKRPNMKEVAMELEGVRMAQMGSAAQAKSEDEDYSSPMILSTDNNEYSWTNTFDFGTSTINSSSDVYPIMFDTM